MKKGDRVKVLEGEWWSFEGEVIDPRPKDGFVKVKFVDWSGCRYADIWSGYLRVI